MASENQKWQKSIRKKLAALPMMNSVETKQKKGGEELDTYHLNILENGKRVDKTFSYAWHSSPSDNRYKKNASAAIVRSLVEIGLDRSEAKGLMPKLAINVGDQMELDQLFDWLDIQGIDNLDNK